MKWNSTQRNSLVRVEGNFIMSQGRNEMWQVNNGAILARVLTITGAKGDNMTINRIPQTDRQQRVLRAKRKGISLHDAQALLLFQKRNTNKR